MKPARLRQTAIADLEAIRDWLSPHGEDTIRNVLDDIDRAIELIRRYPEIGAALPREPFRRLTTRRYRYCVAYAVQRDFIDIAGVFRFQDREI